MLGALTDSLMELIFVFNRAENLIFFCNCAALIGITQSKLSVAPFIESDVAAYFT